jgi:hypothetical protein
MDTGVLVVAMLLCSKMLLMKFIEIRNTNDEEENCAVAIYADKVKECILAGSSMYQNSTATLPGTANWRCTSQGLVHVIAYKFLYPVRRVISHQTFVCGDMNCCDHGEFRQRRLVICVI